VPFVIWLTTQTSFLLLVDIIGVAEEGE
jgi:hypothetical protein